MTTSRFEPFDGLSLAFAVFLLVEGVLLIATGKGLVEHALPRKVGDRGRRWITASVYFLISGILVIVWRRGR